MSPRKAAALLLALAACAALCSSSHADSNTSSEEPFICIVIRTYWGHGRYGELSLAKLIDSLKAQSHQRWEALLLVMDNRPFPDLRSIVRNSNESRVHVYAEWISYKYPPKTEDKQWSEGYHGKLYNLTDEAIRACPKETTWVLVTNGDNDYDSKFLSEVAAVGQDVDLIAFDFFSRYQRPTQAPCERFAAGEGVPNCKQNELSFCNTDLSANVYRYKRLVDENMRFGLIDPSGSSSAMADGMMANFMVQKGWHKQHIQGRCLVEHAPSPQKCALAGGVWDDTIAASPEGNGGSCISEASGMVKVNNNPYIEMLHINVTHDGQSFGLSQGQSLELKCVRYKNPSYWYHQQYFGAHCEAPYDKQVTAQAQAAVEAAAAAAMAVDPAS